MKTSSYLSSVEDDREKVTLSGGGWVGGETLLCRTAGLGRTDHPAKE